jgi:hypothetical protein
MWYCSERKQMLRKSRTFARSLIHSFNNLIAKTLSLCLAPQMPQLIQPNQSAFIKGRTLHDNFWMVQGTAKLLHTRGRPTILLKVDLAKAHSGFSRRWINWVSTLLASASTCIILNGNPGQRICHGRGLR